MVTPFRTDKKRESRCVTAASLLRADRMVRLPRFQPTAQSLAGAVNRCSDDRWPLDQTGIDFHYPDAKARDGVWFEPGPHDQGADAPVHRALTVFARHASSLHGERHAAITSQRFERRDAVATVR